MINWDANATYGIVPEIQEDLLYLIKNGLNPSSIHQGGQISKAAIENTKDDLRKAIGAAFRDEVIFTSGATEANNLAIWSALSPISFRGEIVTTAIEHPSILEPVNQMQNSGCKIHKIHPQFDLNFSVNDFLNVCNENTSLVVVMLANNETGQVLPVDKISRAIKQKFPKIKIHIDAVQGLGKLKINFSEMAIDTLSISAHKIGALPGVGALVAKSGFSIVPQLLGGPQELRRRAGTENWIGIQSFGIALKTLLSENVKWSEIMQKSRDKVQSAIEKELPTAAVLFKGLERIPNTLSVHFKGIKADDLVVAADLKGLCISSGSACASGKPEPSHVLTAMRLPAEIVRETVRISLRHDVCDDEIRRGIGILKDCIGGVS